MFIEPRTDLLPSHQLTWNCTKPLSMRKKSFHITFVHFHASRCEGRPFAHSEQARTRLTSLQPLDPFGDAQDQDIRAVLSALNTILQLQAGIGWHHLGQRRKCTYLTRSVAIKRFGYFFGPIHLSLEVALPICCFKSNQQGQPWECPAGTRANPTKKTAARSRRNFP